MCFLPRQHVWAQGEMCVGKGAPTKDGFPELGLLHRPVTTHSRPPAPHSQFKVPELPSGLKEYPRHTGFSSHSKTEEN